MPQPIAKDAFVRGFGFSSGSYYRQVMAGSFMPGISMESD
jgi:hypothetical protein